MAVIYKTEALIQDLKQGRFVPVYFLQGEEPYYIAQILGCIERYALPASQKSLNFRVCYGNEHSLDEILMYARSILMLGERQVIVVKEAKKLRELSVVQGQKKLQMYVEKPNINTILVFAYTHGKIQSKAFTQGFSSTPSILFCTPKVYESQLPQWIMHYVRQKGYRITEQAVMLLQSLIGTNLSLLAKELQKIMLHVEQDATIDDTLVGTHIGEQREFSVFELQRAIGAKEQEKAFQIIDYFARHAQKYPPIPVVALLTTFFCKLLQLHTLPAMPANEQAAILHVLPCFIEDYLKAAKKHSLAAVTHHVNALHQADLQLKGVDTAPIKSGEVLKELLARIFSFREHRIPDYKNSAQTTSSLLV